MNKDVKLIFEAYKQPGNSDQSATVKQILDNADPEELATTLKQFILSKPELHAEFIKLYRNAGEGDLPGDSTGLGQMFQSMDPSKF